MNQRNNHKRDLGHLYEPGVAYLITFVTHLRQPFFESDEDKDLLIVDLDFYRKKFHYKLVAFVIMPDHTHWVIQPSIDDFEHFRKVQIEENNKYAHAPERFYLSKIMEDIKRHVSYALNGRQNTRGRQVWQKGFHDRKIRNLKALEKILDYLHYNPVEAGIVTEPEAYRYSSYRYYHFGDDSIIRMDSVLW